MTYPLTFVELFAGVGGLSLGLETAGWKCLGHAEWEAFPRRVLKHRWPEVPLWGDVSKLDGREMVAQVGPFTMLTFGAPCQDFSVAGKREGLDGQRSVLVLDAIRIWEQSGAPLALYENVVGMLSSNKGEDFGAILSTFVGARVAVPARGWRGGAGVACGPAGVAAWRTLDAQHFGWDGRTVPQRRRRVFVLCSRDPRIDPAEVLSLAEGVSGHPPKGKRAREGAPAGTGARLASESGAGWWDDSGLARLRAEPGGMPQNIVYESDRAQGLAINISNGEPRVGEVMGTLQARASSGGVGSGAQMNAVLPILEATARQGKSMEGSVGVGQDGDPMFTLQATKQHGVFAFDSNLSQGSVTQDIAPTVKVGSGEGIASPPAVLAFQPGFVARGEGPRPSTDVFPTLGAGTTGDQAPHVVAFAQNQRGELRTSSIAPQLTTGGGKPGEGYSAVLAFDAYNQQVTGDVAKTLGVGSDYSHVPIAFPIQNPESGNKAQNGTGIGNAGDPMYTLESRGHGVLAFGLELANDGSGGNRGYTNPGEPMPTLGTARAHGVVTATIDKQTGLVSDGVSPTLKTDLAHQMGPVVATYEWHGQDSRVRETEVAASLNRNAEGREGHLVLSSGQANAELVRDGSPSLTTLHEAPIVFPPSMQPGVPRRLTPVECERLMGWPDGWTDVPDEKGRPAPDTARYKACGNGVASPVSAWIGFRLTAVLTKDTL